MDGVGIDGCRAGWLAVGLGPGETWEYRLGPQLRDLVAAFPGAANLLLDMPMGLLDGPESERECDRLARGLLGRPRAASVFTPPARATLAAADYQQALEINRRQLGKGLSKQAWNLVPKIREADRLRHQQPGLRGRLREAHPELCFWALNHRHAPLHNKKTPAGRQERLAILRAHRPDGPAIAEAIASATPRSQVAHDDILDALVLAVSASLGRLIPLPEKTVEDGRGIRMEIVYAEPGVATGKIFSF